MGTSANSPVSRAVLRLIEPRDSVSELTELLHRAYAPLAQSGWRYLASWQDENVTRDRIADGECWVAELNGRLIGTATLRPPGKSRGTPWHERPDVCVFGQFAVEPAFQRAGLGTSLVRCLEARARAMGAAHLALDTADEASHLIRFYERMGYRFVEHVQWEQANYRSSILSKPLGEPEP
jgi:GNAT superfamily N-acetyltransferase